MSQIQPVARPASAEILKRIQEVREPLGFKVPRGWATVGLSQTVALMLMPILLLAVLVVGFGIAAEGVGGTAKSIMGGLGLPSGFGF